MKNQTLTQLLNLQCAETQKPIEAGEVVKLFNWGRNRYVIGYGTFVWDSQERCFTLEPCKLLNEHFNLNFFVPDSYDLFRTTPEKLTEKERNILEY